MPNEGYFISNSTTGLLSPCNEYCKNCSKDFTETNQNCDSCKFNLSLQDGNCVEICDKGYYLNDKICHKCHNNCESCTEGSIFDSSGKLSAKYSLGEGTFGAHDTPTDFSDDYFLMKDAHD